MVHVHFRRSSHTLALGELPLVRRPAVLRARRRHARLGGRRGARARVHAGPRPGPRRLQPRPAGGHGRHRRARLPRGDRATAPRSARSVWIAATARRAARGRRLGPARQRGDVALGRQHRAAQARPRSSAMSTCVAAINTSLGLARRDGRRRRTRARSCCWSRPCWPSSSPTAPTSPSAARPPTSRSSTRRSGRSRRASNNAAGLAGLLAMALENFRGEVAEVCLFPAEGEGEGTRISVGGPRGLEVMQPLDEHVARELCELMERDAAARLVTPAEAGGALAGHLQRLGVKSAMLAPLPGVRRHDRDDHGRRPRRASAATSRASEIRLFDTLAHQTGAALGQDQPDHQGRRAARAAGRARAQGLPRPAHRARQPPAVHEPRRLRAQAPHRQRRGHLRRPRQLQADQRHLRPRGRRRGAEGGGRAPARLAAAVRHRGAARRRRVRGAAGRHPRGAHRRGRRPHRRQPHASRSSSTAAS